MTTENNKIIAEFLGGKIDNTFIYFDKTNNKFEDDTLHVSDLLFDTDWNWLMEVVEKIHSLSDHNYKIEISHYTHIDTLPEIIYRKGTMIENTYNACIEFIKWYNQQKR